MVNTTVYNKLLSQDCHLLTNTTNNTSCIRAEEVSQREEGGSECKRLQIDEYDAALKDFPSLGSRCKTGWLKRAWLIFYDGVTSETIGHCF